MNCPKCGGLIEADFGVITCPQCHAVLFIDMDGGIQVSDPESQNGESFSILETVASNEAQPSLPSLPQSPSQFLNKNENHFNHGNGHINSENGFPGKSSAESNYFSEEQDSKIGSQDSNETTFPSFSLQGDLPEQKISQGVSDYSMRTQGSLDTNTDLDSETETELETELEKNSDSSWELWGKVSRRSRELTYQPISIESFKRSITEFAQNESYSELTYSLLIAGVDTGELRQKLLEILSDKRFLWDPQEVIRNLKSGHVEVGPLSAIKCAIILRRISEYNFEVKYKLI